jgi:anti-sigma factor RsiW
MKQTQDSEGLIERYLLGELSAAERSALENEYLVDGSKYDQICRIEDDLLDRYARGALSPVDRERVERHYLTNPWRRRHLVIPRAAAGARCGVGPTGEAEPIGKSMLKVRRR